VSLEQVTDAHEAQRAAQEALDAAQAQFKAAVQATLTEGSATPKQIAEATGLTIGRVYQIRDGRR